MDDQLTTLSRVLERTDDRLRAAADGAARVWPTGFESLDLALGGGFRAGSLALVAGPQGLGKTTFALQVARNAVCAGHVAVYFSYEHDPEDLMQRLVTLEAGERYGVDSPGLDKVRAAFEDHTNSASLDDRMTGLRGGDEALKAVRDYADRLHIHRSTGTSTDLEVISSCVEEVWRSTGQMPLVIVDYLQKVKVPTPGLSDEDRTGVIVESLKDFAIDGEMPVLAVVASDRAGIQAGKRMRVQHLRGSSALAYEADVVLIFNHKYDVVARHHLVYDIGNAERFHQWAVLTLEKNRQGKDGVNLEFRKRFEQSRFESDGHMVTEQLVDERLFQD
ncbi:DnaB-like helicase C-terminal domain-containing protein [Nocardioides donggukensis]|uniref:AAA family ATPase n=1 Tax=Nocardioides donggukensis TaxID=2774019 RepID=A0A927KAH8_9ACTN|nr:DnaB-like helicase C-terminal domain-containing protein [Nocardioides donggukensis]MBD8870746.1 AAA family ATPase [Nocardioides donggukensis]